MAAPASSAAGRIMPLCCHPHMAPSTDAGGRYVWLYQSYVGVCFALQSQMLLQTVFTSVCLELDDLSSWKQPRLLTIP